MFFRTQSGNEPVREWLKNEMSAEARKTIGADIKTVQATWPVDKPLVDSLGNGLREVRSTHDKAGKTRKSDIAIALARKAMREKSR